jgi:sterol desaturase/sphingolipid hydroxylase (fatty acid hydroxylase superfamily)
MSEQRSNGEFHRADPAYRRQMQIVLVLTIVVGVVALVALQWWLHRLGATAQQGDLVAYQTWLNRLLAGLCLILGVSAAGFAQWLYRIGQATKAERRWPPSTMRTSADVRIRYLTSADSLVSQMKGAALALAVLAVLLGAWAIWLFRTS